MGITRKSVWKALFFSLAILNILVIVSLFFILTDADSEKGPEDMKDNTASEEEFTEYLTIQLTREQLNQILKDELQDKPINLEVTSSDVRFSSSYSIIGRTIEATMNFQPEIAETGNIILHQKSVSVGGLSLPGSKVLELVDAQTDMPDYITVDPTGNKVLVELKSLEVGQDYRLKAATFDLQKNNISFNVGK